MSARESLYSKDPLMTSFDDLNTRPFGRYIAHQLPKQDVFINVWPVDIGPTKK